MTPCSGQEWAGMAWSLFFNYSAVVRKRLLEKGLVKTIDVFYYKLAHVAGKYRSHYDKAATSCVPLLLLDNARRHTTNQAKNGFVGLWHSPYSSHMATIDLHFFRFLQHFLAEKLFNGVEQVKSCRKHCFASKSSDWLFFRYSKVSTTVEKHFWISGISCTSCINVMLW